MVYVNTGTNTGSCNVTPNQKVNNNPQPDPNQNQQLYISSRFGGVLNAAIQVLQESIPTGDVHKIVTNL